MGDVNRPHDLERRADIISNRARPARFNAHEGGYENPSRPWMVPSYPSSSDSSSVLASRNSDALFKEIQDEVVLTPAHRFALTPGVLSVRSRRPNVSAASHILMGVQETAVLETLSVF